MAIDGGSGGAVVLLAAVPGSFGIVPLAKYPGIRSMAAGDATPGRLNGGSTGMPVCGSISGIAIGAGCAACIIDMSGIAGAEGVGMAGIDGMENDAGVGLGAGAGAAWPNPPNAPVVNIGAMSSRQPAPGARNCPTFGPNGTLNASSVLRRMSVIGSVG